MIEQLRGTVSVSRLCRTLAVSRSGYCDWNKRRQAPPCRRRQEEARLLPLIAAAHKASRSAYGSPRVCRALRDSGERVGRGCIARLMRQAGIQGLRTQRRRLGTTTSDPAAPQSANLLNRDFTATAPNQTWVSDVTYVETKQGWLYLAVLLDLYARKVVGWATSATFDKELVCKALRQALATRKAPALHHSDRGVQYTSLAYQQLLAAAGIQSSMSAVAQPYDNAVVESFFATLKAERLHTERYATHRQAEAAIFEYIESFYNRIRIHSTNGYQSPDTLERSYHEQHPAPSKTRKTRKNNSKDPGMEQATTTTLA